jgi:hypothetical protein
MVQVLHESGAQLAVALSCSGFAMLFLYLPWPVK